MNMKEFQLLEAIKKNYPKPKAYCMKCGFALEYFSRYHNDHGYECVNPYCMKIYGASMINRLIGDAKT